MMMLTTPGTPSLVGRLADAVAKRLVKPSEAQGCFVDGCCPYLGIPNTWYLRCGGGTYCVEPNTCGW